MKEILLILSALIVTAEAQQNNCGARADIIFVVDSSGSVAPANFETTKNFIKNMASGFTIGTDDVLIGLVKYSTNVMIEFNLKDHLNISSVSQAIDNMQFIGGGTSTGAAITAMMKQGFAASSGARQGVVKIGIVITDGISGDDISGPADAARKAGIKMFSIGVGAGIRLLELETIASQKNYVFTVTNFAGLDTIKANLQAKACKEATKPPPTPTPAPITTTLSTTPKYCGARADIVFVVDSSGSVGPFDFDIAKNFIKNIVNGFQVGSDDVLIGVVKYSSTTYVEFNLKDHLTNAAVSSAIDQIQYQGGGTATGAALQTMLTKSFSAEAGARQGITKLAIVITDGQSGDPIDEPVKAAKSAGVKIFAIGVGSSIRQNELEYIASQRTNVFNVKNFAGLDTIKANLQDKACQEATKPLVPQTTSTQATPATPCLDNLVFCGSFGQHICSKAELQQWIELNCKKYCNRC